METKCNICIILSDACCSECSDYQKCIDKGIDFIDVPAEYPGCFKCIYKNQDECTAKQEDHLWMED